MVEASSKSAHAVQRQIVERILASPHLSKSARLSELFSYLCDRVLDHDVQAIHELELGHKVFGRLPRYDTTADNIVRVHASQLRKRLAEYFQAEGRDEDFVIEIPRGNYAPIFRPRTALERFEELEPATFAVPSVPIAALAEAPAVLQSGTVVQERRTPWLLLAMTVAAVVFAALSTFLYFHQKAADTPPATTQSLVSGPSASRFWAAVFPAGHTTDVVSDDASLGFYTEATGKPVRIGEYFDRSYLRGVLDSPGPPEHDPHWLHQLLIRRLSNYAGSSMEWKLAQVAGAEHSNTRMLFARDLSFRHLKTDNLVLLGTPSANPWIQLFESSTTLHWNYDPVSKLFFPVDTTDANANRYRSRSESKTRESYATISLLPNLGGTGSVLILSGSGGAATDAAMEWLLQDSSLDDLLAKLPASTSGFPAFEALLLVEKGMDHPRSVTLAVLRPVKQAQPAPR